MNSVGQSRKEDYIRTAIGTTVGIAPTAYLLYDTLKPISKDTIPMLQGVTNNIFPPIDTFQNTKRVAETIIKNEGLADKGVYILIANNTPESQGKLDNIFKTEKPKFFVKKIKMILQNGCNACFHEKSNSVIVNDVFATSGIFHEIGHAKHYNSKNPLMKLLVKSKNITPMGVSLVAPIALGIAMFHKTDKTKPQKDKTKTEKTLDFVSNHAGKLTLASYIPLVLEEGLASIDGIKMAKKHLSTKQLSTLKTGYFKAWKTYAGTALLIAGAVGLANVIKQGRDNENTPTSTKTNQQQTKQITK